MEQHDFDRIIKIGIERAGVRSTLIVELFARGNLLIVDSENKIILPMNPVTMRDRRLRSGEIYELPEAQLSPIDAKVSDLMKAFSESTADLVRTIATRFNLGGVMQKIYSRAKIEKSKPAKEASEEDAYKLSNAMLDLFAPLFRARNACNEESQIEIASGVEIEIKNETRIEAEPLKLRPQHVKKEINGKMETFDVLPFDLIRYSECEKEYFDFFNTALDEFFGKKALENIVKVKEAEKTEKNLNVYERRASSAGREP